MSYDPTIGRFIQRDPIGYDDGMNLYQFVQSNPLRHVDPDGRQSRPSAATRPSTTTQPVGKPAIAGPGETLVGKPTFVWGWMNPYTCDVWGEGSGLARYGPKIESVAGKKAVAVFAEALGLTPFDLAGYGYASSADIWSQTVKRDSDGCTRTAIYVDVKEFIAVPKWDDLYEWERARIQKSQPAAENYPREDTKSPNPAVGLDEWKAIRELMNRADGVAARISDPGGLNRLVVQRSKNAKRIIFNPGTWSEKPAK